MILFFGQFIIDVEMQPCGPSLRKGAIFPLVIYTDLFLVCVVAFLLCTSFVIYHILYVRQCWHTLVLECTTCTTVCGVWDVAPVIDPSLSPCSHILTHVWESILS